MIHSLEAAISSPFGHISETSGHTKNGFCTSERKKSNAKQRVGLAMTLFAVLTTACSPLFDKETGKKTDIPSITVTPITETMENPYLSFPTFTQEPSSTAKPSSTRVPSSTVEPTSTQEPSPTPTKQGLWCNAYWIDVHRSVVQALEKNPDKAPVLSEWPTVIANVDHECFRIQNTGVYEGLLEMGFTEPEVEACRWENIRLFREKDTKELYVPDNEEIFFAIGEENECFWGHGLISDENRKMYLQLKDDYYKTKK